MMDLHSFSKDLELTAYQPPANQSVSIETKLNISCEQGRGRQESVIPAKNVSIVHEQALVGGEAKMCTQLQGF